jgi:hypothetical protein
MFRARGREATWTNGKRRITGWYIYHWPSDRFHITLDYRDRITGQSPSIITTRDKPEWGNWKLVEAGDE